ncbi:MAG TPA: hypothetical protein PKL04_00735 [Methanofastidiosum sp.]|nr:hypothetical protein [Methanofastidiosum sp.]
MTNREKALKQLDLIMESFDKFYIYVDENLVANQTTEIWIRTILLNLSDEFTARCNKMKDIIYNKKGNN